MLVLDITPQPEDLDMKPMQLASVAVTLGLMLGAVSPAHAQHTAPPAGGYKKVSAITTLPDFIPGLGTLYVDPATLPAGPFLAYDKQGTLVSSIYMIPLKDLNAQKAFENLGTAHNEPVDHVDVVYNPGHAGVAEPHYHVILWYVTKAQAAKLQ